MGWRTTAQNFNLNRDYVKADAPEMQAMLALVNAWDPLTYVDLHVTDGAKFQHDVSIQVEPVYSGDPEFRKAGLALRDGRHRRHHEAGLVAAVLLHVVQAKRRPGLGLRRQRVRPALLDRLLPAAQPHGDAGRDPFVEGLSDPRAHHPQFHRLGAGAGGQRTARNGSSRGPADARAASPASRWR
jgi:hypothetical protein